MPPHLRQWWRQLKLSKGAWQPRQTAVSSSPSQRGATSCMVCCLCRRGLFARWRLVVCCLCQRCDRDFLHDGLVVLPRLETLLKELLLDDDGVQLQSRFVPPMACKEPERVPALQLLVQLGRNSSW